MYPNSSILKKPRFGVITQIFVLLHYSYDDFQPVLLEALNKPNITTSQRTRLINMKALYEFYIPICLWYMIAIRSKDKDLIKKAQGLLSIALISLESNIYLRAIFLSLSLRRYFMKSGHPIKEIFGDASYLNEEKGEISLSNLSASLLRQQTKLNNSEETSKSYKMVGLARTICEELNEDLGFRNDLSLKEKRGMVDHNDLRIPTLVLKAKELIILMTGNWTEYPILKGKIHFYPSKSKVELVSGVPSKVILNESMDIKEIIENETEKLNTLLSPVVRANRDANRMENNEIPLDYEIISHEQRGGSNWYSLLSITGRVSEHEEEELDVYKLDFYWENTGNALEGERAQAQMQEFFNADLNE